MPVIGIGTDLCDIDRIARIIAEQGDRFLAKVFTQNEISYCRPKHHAAQCFAARFAAKEALLKALGVGLRDGLRWKDMEIENDALGKPFFKLSGKCAQQTSGTNIMLSLSHTQHAAVAFVIIDSG